VKNGTQIQTKAKRRGEERRGEERRGEKEEKRDGEGKIPLSALT
jgi:hypothetical protein